MGKVCLRQKSVTVRDRVKKRFRTVCRTGWNRRAPREPLVLMCLVKPGTLSFYLLSIMKDLMLDLPNASVFSLSQTVVRYSFNCFCETTANSVFTTNTQQGLPMLTLTMFIRLTSLNLPCCSLIPFLLVLLSRNVKTRLLTDAVFGRVSNSYQAISNSPPRSYFWSDLEFQQRGEQSWAKGVTKQPYSLRSISFPSRSYGLTAGCAPLARLMERCLGAGRRFGSVTTHKQGAGYSPHSFPSLSIFITLSKYFQA